MGVIPNPKMAFIFPSSCILALIFPILIKYFPKCVGKGSFPKSQIKSLWLLPGALTENLFILRAMKSSRGSLPTLGNLVLQAPTEIHNSIFTKALQQVEFFLFDLILYVHSTIFQLCGTNLPGLNQY